jgi:phosphopantetheinyl transferase
MPAFVVVPHDAPHHGVERRLSPGDSDRLAALRHQPARLARFLAGRAALLRAAAELGEEHIMVEARCFECGVSHGRPTAAGAGTPLHLGLAHAGGLAFAVAARAPVGIDAEPVDTPPGRMVAIGDIAPGHGDLLRRWTTIEAVLKADGRGLRVAPSAVHVGVGRATLDGRRYRLRSLRAEGCRVTVATLVQPESGGSRV